MRAFIDSNVPIFAVGGDGPARTACRELMSQAADGKVELHASVELVQEFLFHRLRRVERTAAVAQTRHLANVCVLHAFDGAVLEGAVALVESGQLRGRDAVHAATALRAGFSELVSFDVGFEQCQELRRLEPGQISERLG